ncbi:MAG: hypothetical protein IPO17_13865 [Flavobacteriales bacterium]|nr:hypothetical protein [Flavobacteriales bacterium]
MTARNLLIGVFCSAVTLANGQQITNGAFESWTDLVAYRDIDVWRDGNYQIPGTSTTTRVSGQIGQYAARMETVNVSGNTTFGFIVHGEFAGQTATEGVPFTTAVDAMEGWYRYSLMPDDSAMIYLLLWNNGVALDTIVHLIGGTQSQWTAFSLPVNGGVPVTPDSVVVAVTSSNPFALTGMAAGSWIEVDDLQLTSTTVLNPDLLPNNGMEDWTDITTEEPDGWTTFNPLLAQLGYTPVTKSTMAHAGTYSIRMETIDLGGDTLPGIITNGDLFGAGLFSGIPYNDTPSLMTAFYQYAPVGTDTAGVAALFIKNGLLLEQAYLQITSAAAVWTFTGAPILLFQEPDTLVIQIYAGSNPGSVLYLDDLAFSGISTGISTATMSAIRAWPQPATDVLNVSLGDIGTTGTTTRVLDRMGRVVLEGSVGSRAEGQLVLPMQGLTSGHYILEVRSGDRVERLPFVKG